MNDYSKTMSPEILKKWKFDELGFVPKVIRQYEEYRADKPTDKQYDWQYIPDNVLTSAEYYLRWRPNPKDLDEAVDLFYTELLPRAFDMAINIDEMYRDYAIHYSRFLNRTMMAGYTPWGIKQIDSYFCRRIRQLESLTEARVLEEEIIGCHHLHIKIRENLMANLFNNMENLQ